LKVIDVFTPAGVMRSEMIIRFRQHQRQARHPHYPDHSRVEAAVRNRRTSRAPLSIPQPPSQSPRETREPGSRLSSIPRSWRSSWHHRRFHPQPQKVRTHERWATRVSHCGLFKKSAATATPEKLHKYLEVRPDQVRGAVCALSTLSYLRKHH